MKKKTTFLPFLVAIITIIVFASPRLCPAEQKPQSNVPPEVLATVGEKKITQADIDAKTSLMPPQFRARYETPEGKRKLLEQITKFSLLSQEAYRLGIDKKEDVARKIKEIADNIIIQELTKQEITDKITITDEDIAKYFEARKNEFIKPEKVKVNLILFEVNEDDPPQVQQEKKKKAEETLKRIKAGEDFETLAKELSDDKRTKKRGGNTGFFSRGKRKITYGPVFEEKAFSMKVGEVSDVFKDKRGYYIIKVTDKKPQKEQTLEEVKKRIERKLRQQRQKEAYENYIEELKKKYPITIYEDHLKVANQTK